MPDTFSYLNVLIAIVLGLALANLLGGLGRLMHARKRVKIYLPSLLFTTWMFFAIVQDWWADYDLRRFPNLGFSGFVATLMLPVILYLLCTLVLPPEDTGGTIDLRAWYYDNRKWFFGLLVLIVPFSYLFEYLAKGTFHKGNSDSAFLITLTIINLVGFLTANERVHAIISVAVGAFMVAYITFLFAHLPGMG